MNDEKNSKRELNELQIRHIRLLTHLYAHNAITDDIVNDIRLTELEYFNLLEKYRILEQKVNIDEKTNLLKFKKDYLTTIVKTASRIYQSADPKKYHISLARIDIDDFSIFNNRYGHDVGDKVLIEIAEILRTSSRPTDYVIRFGGEEFDVILPATDIEGAVHYLEKVFAKVRSHSISFNEKQLNVTISAGVSELIYDLSNVKLIISDHIEKDYEALQAAADNALYEAKYLGKDRFCVYNPEKENIYPTIRKNYCKK
ncbi:MAG: GGDEF domain-containing protein [Spirochaetes bacterium]|nr:GGDEF domain-containing protein [Spirochaetota bacterium]